MDLWFVGLIIALAVSTWGAVAMCERLLGAVGPDIQAERLVRAGKRAADRLDAEWLVMFVETPDLIRLSEGERIRRIAILRLAASLGAEAITLGGSSVSAELLEYARTRNVSRILVGTSSRARWRRLLRPSTTDRLLAGSRDIDVLVIARDSTSDRPDAAATMGVLPAVSEKVRWPRYALAVVATLVATCICWVFYGLYPRLGQANLVMIYLLTTALVAVYGGRRTAILSSVLGVAAFEFMFVPPRFTFAVSDAQYLITFAIMLIVALIIGGLNASVRLQARVAGHRERRTAALYAMSRQLTMARGRDEMAELAVGHVSQVFASRVAVLFPDDQARLVLPRSQAPEVAYPDADLGVAQWVFDHTKPAGLGTDTLSGAKDLYLPLAGADRVLGVLAVLPQNAWRAGRRHRRHWAGSGNLPHHPGFAQRPNLG